MKCLLILLLFTSLQVRGQANDDEMRSYIELVLNSGAYLPSAAANTNSRNGVTYRQKTNIANLEEFGFDAVMRQHPSDFCVSYGMRVGNANLRSTDTAGKEYHGEGPYLCFVLGANYVYHTNRPSAFRAGLLLGIGQRADGAGQFLYTNPYLYSELTLTKYLNKYFGVGLNVGWHPWMYTLFEDKDRYGKEGTPFQMWSVSIKLCSTFFRDRKYIPED